MLSWLESLHNELTVCFAHRLPGVLLEHKARNSSKTKCKKKNEEKKYTV